MPRSMVIRRLHGLLTVILLLMLAGFAVYQHYVGPPYNDKLFTTRQLDDNTWLYITKYQGGGATVSNVYRYYLAGRLTGNITDALGDIAPLLTTDSEQAKITKIGNLVTVKITGKVYNFTNSIFYISAGVDMMPVVEFYAINTR